MENFIGNKNVVTVVLLEEKTPGGNEMVNVHFGDGTSEIMPKTRFELIVSEEKSDATTVQNKLRARTGGLMYSVLHEYGVKMGEVNDAVDSVTKLINAGYERARDVKFGFDFLDLPLIEVNKVLLDANTKNSNNGPTSVGGSSDTGNQN